MKKTILAMSGVLLVLASAFAADKVSFAPLPEASASLGAVICDDYLYTYGGHTGKTHKYSTADVSGKFRRLKLVEGSQWEELPGGPILQGMNLVTHKGKVIRVGGMSPRNKLGDPADNHSSNEVARFDPATKQWDNLAPLPQGRSSHDVVVIGDKLFVVGGWTMRGDEESVWQDTALVMDLTAPKPEWKSMKQPFSRRALTAVSHQGKVWVCGGLGDDTEAQHSVDIYDPAKDSWSKGPDFPGTRIMGFSPAACSVDDKLYLNVSDGVVYRLSDAGDKWEKFSTIENPRMVHRLVSDRKDRLLAVGGTSRKGNAKLIDVVNLSAQ